ncbi:SulP family inorganic anion transporter [Nitrincola nitratireducens]|uniref:Putative sulfate transporterc n=3 Tax=Nitrincola TaxID=267849 RepID=W9UQP6_9GAMM|nr:SulP family inorganic anion transporter [Nitrincola nitratireducens]EXJ09399.1 putative sulfate transporterc [Nitrincola nitratireducens]
MRKQNTSHPKGNALYSGVWGLIRAGGYQRALFVQDLSAALVVTLMLIPQSLAYALLAGLPLHVGLYASVLPLVAYALFGTSSSLSVGPMAIIALLIAITLEP